MALNCSYKPCGEEPSSRLFDLKEEIRDIVERAGFHPDYYALGDATSSVPYDYYLGGEEASDKQPIFVRRRGGKLEEISKLSEAIKAIAGRREMRFRVYVPAECRQQVEALLG